MTNDLEMWQSEIAKGAIQLDITLTPNQMSLLLGYVEELTKWNKAYNLTAVRDPLEMIKLHVLDSLAILAHLSELEHQLVIDIGTGAGLPGMILAIMLPNTCVHLLDTNGKKTRFLTQFKHLKSLDNVTVINQRCESYVPENQYDIVLSRAFASITDMLNGCHHLVSNTGVFVAMKGVYPQQELEAMPSNFSLINCKAIRVPGVDAERHLLTIQKQLM